MKVQLTAVSLLYVVRYTIYTVSVVLSPRMYRKYNLYITWQMHSPPTKMMM